MATKTKTQAAAPPTDVTVSRSVLKQFISLVDGLEAADAVYQSCQATLFRNWAQKAYRAGNVQKAVAQAKAALGDE